MKICLVTETFPPEVNGVAMTLFSLVRGLKEKGHEVQVVRPRQKSGDVSDSGLNIEQFSVVGVPIPGYSGLRIGLPCRSTLIRLWKKSRPDVIYIATEGPLGHSALRAARHMRLPMVSGFHTNFQQYMMHYNLGLLKDPAELYLKDFHNRTLATFVPTEDTRSQLFEMGFRNLKLMGRGVDTRLFDPAHRDESLRAEWGAEADDPVVIYVGRVASEKNMPLFFRSLKSLMEIEPRLKAVVVGDGPERRALQEAHPEVVFAGMQKGEALARHYASADVFLFPSTTETFGNVVTEALASGLVIVAFDYAAPRQYIRSEINGFLAPMRDEESFVAKARLAVAISRYPTMKREARETAMKISWDVVMEGFERDLMDVLGQVPKEK